MLDPRQELIRFEAQKRKDLKGLLLVAAISLALAFIADALARISSFFGPVTPHVQERAWIYVLLGYGVLVPVSMALQKSSMQGFTPRQGGLVDRLFMLVLCLSLALPIFFSPEWLLVDGEDLIGRSRSLYRGIMGSVPSLALIGTFLFYAAAGFVWLLSAAINHVFVVKKAAARDS